MNALSWYLKVNHLMVNFLTQIPGYNSHSPVFWTYFSLLTLIFVQHWLSLQWEILIMFLFQFILTLLNTQKGIPFFIALFMTCAAWDGPHDMLNFVTLFMDGLQLSQGYGATTRRQFTGWVDLEPRSGFEPGTLGFGIQHPNH